MALNFARNHSSRQVVQIKLCQLISMGYDHCCKLITLPSVSSSLLFGVDCFAQSGVAQKVLECLLSVLALHDSRVTNCIAMDAVQGIFRACDVSDVETRLIESLLEVCAIVIQLISVPSALGELCEETYQILLCKLLVAEH